jgi:branched-chain amino acid transport system permease protein
MGQVAAELLNGLASASSLFLVASGLTLIFGVTRIVNFAHGSFYMLGAYIGVTVIQGLSGGPLGFWGGLLVAAIAVGVIGAVMEILVLRRIYDGPELFPLLATFGVVLVVQDLTLLIWGPEEILGPRAPGLTGAVPVGDAMVPTYDLFLIVLAPLVLLALWLLFNRTRWGTLVRAATEDQQMVATLGVNQKVLFTSVFFLGAALAGLGGAIQLPKSTANLSMDLDIIAAVFVVTVVGGMGSILGAYLAAVLISLIRALLIANADLTLAGVAAWQLELVSMFLVMAVVLIVRPWGLLGQRESQEAHHAPGSDRPLRPADRTVKAVGAVALAAVLAMPLLVGPYGVTVATEVLILAVFAASLHFMMGIGGMISFGHAAYFGLGAYGAALLVDHFAWPMSTALFGAPALAAAGALIFGWFCVRLTGVYLAMLTLAFAQIAWSITFQWVQVTGGDNGILGIWPPQWLPGVVSFYYFAAAICVAALLVLRHLIFSPFGYTLRAARDAPLRAEAIGIDVRRHRWFAFAASGTFAGLAGGLYAFFKGSVSPDLLSIPQSVDALVMVLLGGVETLAGPIVGAAVFGALHAELIALTTYWRGFLGLIIVVLVLLFPQGIAGGLESLRHRFGWAR